MLETIGFGGNIKFTRWIILIFFFVWNMYELRSQINLNIMFIFYTKQFSLIDILAFTCRHSCHDMNPISSSCPSLHLHHIACRGIPSLSCTVPSIPSAPDRPLEYHLCRVQSLPLRRHLISRPWVIKMLRAIAVESRTGFLNVKITIVFTKHSQQVAF